MTHPTAIRKAESPPSFPSPSPWRLPLFPKPSPPEVKSAMTVARESSYPPRWTTRERDMKRTDRPRTERRPPLPPGEGLPFDAAGDWGGDRRRRVAMVPVAVARRRLRRPGMLVGLRLFHDGPAAALDTAVAASEIRGGVI